MKNKSPIPSPLAIIKYMTVRNIFPYLNTYVFRLQKYRRTIAKSIVRKVLKI